MIRTYTIVRQISVCTTVDECWRYLTDPHLIGEWFADTLGSFGQNDGFEFHFGDGDFFRGVVGSADAPVSLRFRWHFMGAGLASDIEYALLPLPDGKTLVSVIDRGEHTAAGAAEMCEGWDDFLSRLERRIRTGENSRYRWTETIGCAAAMRVTPDHAREFLRNPGVWSVFPQTDVTVDETDGALNVTMTNPAWDGRTTDVSLRFRPNRAGACVSVVHRGFDRLNEALQFDERKRYAGYWAAFLAELESPEVVLRENEVAASC